MHVAFGILEGASEYGNKGRGCYPLVHCVCEGGWRCIRKQHAHRRGCEVQGRKAVVALIGRVTMSQHGALLSFRIYMRV